MEWGWKCELNVKVKKQNWETQSCQMHQPAFEKWIQLDYPETWISHCKRLVFAKMKYQLVMKVGFGGGRGWGDCRGSGTFDKVFKKKVFITQLHSLQLPLSVGELIEWVGRLLSGWVIDSDQILLHLRGIITLVAFLQLFTCVWFKMFPQITWIVTLVAFV